MRVNCRHRLVCAVRTAYQGGCFPLLRNFSLKGSFLAKSAIAKSGLNSLMRDDPLRTCIKLSKSEAHMNSLI